MRLAAALGALILVSAAAQAAANAKNGEIVFGRCAQCHTAAKGGGNGLGPNLFGVSGRKAAALPGFPYSPALKNANITWTDANLHKWFENPMKMVPGTRMAFAGVRRSQDIDDLIAYLKTQK